MRDYPGAFNDAMARAQLTGVRFTPFRIVPTITISDEEHRSILRGRRDFVAGYMAVALADARADILATVCRGL